MWEEREETESHKPGRNRLPNPWDEAEEETRYFHGVKITRPQEFSSL
jgi:hypothetical protein